MRDKKILINSKGEETLIAVVEEGRLEEFYVESREQKALVGNIYKGIIRDVVPSVGACFVDVGLKQKGFLYLSDLSGILKIEEEEEEEGWLRKIFRRRKKVASLDITPGKDILVQVVKDPYKNKAPRLTTHITLASRTLVFIYGSRHFGVSRRIQEQGERRRLLDILKRLKIPRNWGIIARTASEYADRKKIIADYNYLMNLWKLLSNRRRRMGSPSLLYEEYDLVLRTIRDYISTDVGSVYIDNLNDFNRIRKFCRVFYPEFTSYIHFYNKDTSLFKEYRITQQLKDIFSPKVYLNCGAFITIEPTEALTVIDVNSGRYKSQGSQEDASFFVNMEAAREIARQLRLRDIGGIIVIDFIDMKKEIHRSNLIKTFKIYLNKDRAKTEIVSFSPLGILEMTRERTRKMPESIYFITCPSCEGRGKIKSPRIVVQEILSSLKRLIPEHKYFVVKTNILLKDYLKKSRFFEEIQRLKENFSIEIRLEDSKSILPGDFKIEPVSKFL